jgi:hypothetical protein
MDESHYPAGWVAGASITLKGTNRATSVNKMGEYAFDYLPVGAYAVVCTTERATINGERDFRDTVLDNISVFPDSSSHLDIYLEPMPAFIEISKSDSIPLSSLTNGWKLFKSEYGYFGNSSATLIAARDGDRRIIFRTTSLKGYVNISTPEQALEFVRLFSDTNTFYLFKPNNRQDDFLEVTLEATKLGDLHVPSPIVTSFEGYFRIERFVCAYDGVLYKIQEKLSPDGEYVITKRDTISTKLQAWLPMAM